MSDSTTPLPREGVRRLGKALETSQPTLHTGLKLVSAPVRFVAFWLAVALPFLYLPLLASGLEGQQPTVFGTLLALNSVALLVGHGHGR